MSSPAASNIARRTSSAALSRSVTESAETGSATSALADSLIRPPIRVTVYPARIIAPHASRAKDSASLECGRLEVWEYGSKYRLPHLQTSTPPYLRLPSLLPRAYAGGGLGLSDGFGFIRLGTGAVWLEGCARGIRLLLFHVGLVYELVLLPDGYQVQREPVEHECRGPAIADEHEEEESGHHQRHRVLL